MRASLLDFLFLLHTDWKYHLLQCSPLSCIFIYLSYLVLVDVPVSSVTIQNLSFFIHSFPGSYSFLYLFALKIHL